MGQASPSALNGFKKATSEADLIILLGVRLSLYIGWGRTFNPEAKVIQMDIEPEEIGRNKPADLPIFSDINRAIIKLNSSIGDNFDFSKWLTACENWKKDEWAEVDKLKASDEKPLHVLRVVKAIEDYFGNVTCKEINRPSICHNLCEVLLTIDEHDRMRENVLGLERKWLTKDFKFR